MCVCVCVTSITTVCHFYLIHVSLSLKKQFERYLHVTSASQPVSQSVSPAVAVLCLAARLLAISTPRFPRSHEKLEAHRGIDFPMTDDASPRGSFTAPMLYASYISHVAVFSILARATRERQRERERGEGRKGGTRRRMANDTSRTKRDDQDDCGPSRGRKEG